MSLHQYKFFIFKRERLQPEFGPGGKRQGHKERKQGVKKKISCWVLAIALFVTGGVCGAMGEEYVRVSLGEAERLARFQKLDTILRYLETYSIS